MNNEVFSGSSGDFDPFEQVGEFLDDSNIELFYRKETIAPAMAAVISKLRKAEHSDEALINIDSDRTRYYHIRMDSDENYPFVHDRLVLIPKNRIDVGVARKELRFAVASNDEINIRPKFIFITDFDKDGELISESIMTETSFGWYDDDVSLGIDKDHVYEVAGLQHDPDFDGAYYAEILSYYELAPQTNDYTEAA